MPTFGKDEKDEFKPITKPKELPATLDVAGVFLIDTWGRSLNAGLWNQDLHCAPPLITIETEEWMLNDSYCVRNKLQ